MNQPSTEISPGLGGFLAFFLLALALWLLMRSMNTRLRRLNYREEQDRKAAESAAQQGPPAEAAPAEAPAEAGPGEAPAAPPAEEDGAGEVPPRPPA